MKHILMINRTKRNSIFTLTNRNGDVLYTSSVGALGYKGTKKKSSIIHYSVALLFAQKLKNNKITNIQIHFNGKKNYRKTILNAFRLTNIKFAKHILDKTPLAYNGCKKKKK